MIVTPQSTSGAALLPALWVAVVVLLALAAAIAFIPRWSRFSPMFSTAGAGAALILGLWLVLTNASLSASGGTVLGFVPFAVHYDALSGAFLIAFGASAGAASLSVVGEEPRSPAEGAVYPLFLGSIAIVLGASNAFSFLIAWEAMALLSAFLVVGVRPSKAVVSAGNVYLAVTHVATAAILISFAILASNSGGSLDFQAWHAAAPSIPWLTRDGIMLFAFIGFATKAGAMPFHIWLPRAHPVAPSHVSAVMSGVMIKTGIYGLIRILIDVVGGTPDWVGLLILAVGAFSAVVGVLYALMQHDLKRLLAYHSIENIGIILIALGSAILLESHGAHELAALALAAAIFHSINHALFKTLLFLGAGAVLHATGLRDLNHLGGLGRRMPVTMLAFMIGAAAISGLPPLNGFASEWLTFQGLLATAGGHDIAPIARFAAAGTIGALALTTGLAVACFVKATGIAFLGLPRSAAAAAAQEVARPALAAMAALAAACVATGLAAGPAFHALLGVARVSLHSASGPAGPIPSTFTPAVTAGPHTDFAATYTPLAVGLLLILAVGIVALAARYRILLAARRVERIAEPRRVDTWACGIAPRAAFQYNATSYSKPVRIFFRRIFSPEREVRIEYHPGTAFPSSISYRSHVTLVVEDRIWRPLHALSLRAANFARKLQGGAIQIYIAYCVIAVLLLLAWARWS